MKPSRSEIDDLKKYIWRSKQTALHTYPTINTGFDELNQCLKLGGWPLGNTTEIGIAEYGIGELRLLIPALRKLFSSVGRPIIWIAPPYQPYARALIKMHIDTNSLIIVKPSNTADILWAAEQALLANCCTAVFTWTDRYNLTQKETRRLQLASEQSNAWHVQFRHSDCLQQASAARLRLHLQANIYSELEVHIKKQPQAWAGQYCTLSLPPHYQNWQRIVPELLPQHNRQFGPISANTQQKKSHTATNNKIAKLSR